MKQCARVLYVMDGDFGEFETLKQVLDLAEKYQFELTLFDIAQSIAPSARLMITSMPPNDLRDRTVRARLRQLEALVSMIERRSFQMRARASFGNRAKEIVSEAARGSHDLVIKRREKGRTDKHVLKDCPCAIWVLGPEDYTESGEIIASNAPRLGPRNESRVTRECVQGFSSPGL